MSKEFSGKEACIAPEGVFIIGTYDENGVPNAMNAAWGSQSDFDEITLFLDKHKTTDNVKKTGAFTVAFATKDTMVLADYFGVETGILVGKIVAQQADESVLTDGLVDYDKLQPIMYDSSTKTYRLIGPVVGKAFHDGLALKK